MAHPIAFPGHNTTFGPPPGLDEMIGHLPVFMNGQTVVSAWQLELAELQAIIDAGGIVFLSVMSGVHVFPCYVGSEETTKAVASDTGKVW